MYEDNRHLDFASLAHLPAEEALLRLYEHCAALEAHNAELTVALEESRLILQSFVMAVLQRDGKLLEKASSLDISLGDFLRGNMPASPSETQSAPSSSDSSSSAAPAPQENQLDDPEPHPEPLLPKADTAASPPSGITASDGHIIAEAPAEHHPAAEPAAIEPDEQPAVPAPLPVLKVEDSYQEWPDSPMLPLSFGGQRAQDQRSNLLAWMRDSSQTLSPDLFNPQQLRWLEPLLQGSCAFPQSNVSLAAHKDDFYASVHKQLQEHSSIWQLFSTYANQLLRDWSLSIEIDMDEFDEPETYLGSPQPEISVQATEDIKADADIVSSFQLLTQHLYRLPSPQLQGCEHGSPLSAAESDDATRIILRSDWCSLAQPEKISLLNWQLHSAAYRNSNLLKTVKTVIALEESLEDLGCTLIKRTASTAMSRAHCPIPTELIMEMSGIWGNEQIEELDDLLIRLYQATDYQPFLCAREFIASPSPLLQLFDLSADTVSLQLTDAVSVSRAAIAQILGTVTLNKLTEENWPKILRQSHPALAYLHRRLAGIWIASLPQ
ncbi:MAG: hypothetical protein Q4F00_05225 [bacterium]|nr:hypothetical protein [bacterium]